MTDQRDPSLVTQAGKAHYLPLDALRGVCAFLVMLLHFPSSSALVNTSFVKESWLFVDFFFLLSGFVIASSYAEKLNEGMSKAKFLFLRLGRLYPTHLAVLLVAVAFHLLMNLAHWRGYTVPPAQLRGVDTLPSLAMTATLTHAVGFPQTAEWNGPSWSISVELWLYVAAAFMFAWWRRPVRAFLVVAVLSLAWLALTGDRNMLRINEHALARGLYDFSLGIAAYAVLRGAWFTRWHGAMGRTAQSVIEVAICLLVVAFLSMCGKGPSTLLAPLLFAPAVIVFARGQGVVSTTLRRPAFVYLGKISYPLYLVHYFILMRLLNVAEMVTRRFGLPGMATLPNGSEVFDMSPAGVAASLVCVVVVIIVAGLLHRFVEDPGRLWSRRVAHQWWPVDAGAGSTRPNAAAASLR